MDTIITISVVVTITILIFYKRAFQYWQKKKIPTIPPEMPFGNIRKVVTGKENLAITIQWLYKQIKQNGWQHAGIYVFTSPNYLPVDLNAIKDIMSKDFQYFTDRATYCNEKKNPVSGYLFNLKGQRWAHVRAKVTPTFTQSKIKTMFGIITECALFLQKQIAHDCDSNRPIDVKDRLGAFTIDVIGCCAFGLECNTLGEGESVYRKNVQMALSTTFWQRLKLMLCSNFPKIALFFNIGILPSHVSEFFVGTVNSIVKYRQENNYKRNDFIQLLIDLKDNNELSLEEVAAQSITFFLTAFETSSLLLTFALYELAKNAEMQDKARQEIRNALQGREMSFEAVQKLEYLGRVLDETLRKYPPLPIINRKCVKDYKLPNQDITIDKDTTVIIPVFAIHHDEDYYPEPEKFDPDRFTEQEKQLRHQYAFIPFGEGTRFALLQTKIALSTVLRSFKFTVNKATQGPIQFDPNTYSLCSLGKIWLDAEKL